MAEFLNVLLLTLPPVAGVVIGTALAEAIKLSEKTLSFILHMATGAVLAVVGVELMPRALEADPAWLMVLAFILGGIVYTGLEVLQNWFGKGGGQAARSGVWMVFFGIGFDIMTDGVMIGTGSLLSAGLGLVLALGLAFADFLESFVTTATFKQQKVKRPMRFLLAGAFVLLIPLGAAVGYWLLRAQSETVQLGVLAFTAGILTLVMVEELAPRADKGDTRLASLSVLVGFSLFTLVSVYLG